MYEISELTFLRLTLLICAPTIVMLVLAPIMWMVLSSCKAFKDDPSSPSFIVSYLWKQSKWYVSIARYSEKFAGGKKTIMSSQHSWLTFAIIGLLRQWFKYWWPNVFKPKMKATKEKIASLFVKPVNVVEAVREHNFDLFLNDRKWNATQKMFISAVKNAVLRNGYIDHPSQLNADPFNRIGNIHTLFTPSDRNSLYRLAGCSGGMIDQYERLHSEKMKINLDQYMAKVSLQVEKSMLTGG